MIKKLLFLFKSTQGRFPSANPSKCVISRTKTNIIGHPPFWLTESTNHIPASHPSPNIDFFVSCVKVHRTTKFLITAQGRCYKWLQTFDFYGAQSSFVNYFKNDSSRSIWQIRTRRGDRSSFVILFFLGSKLIPIHTSRHVEFKSGLMEWKWIRELKNWISRKCRHQATA